MLSQGSAPLPPPSCSKRKRTRVRFPRHQVPAYRVTSMNFSAIGTIYGAFLSARPAGSAVSRQPLELNGHPRVVSASQRVGCPPTLSQDPNRSSNSPRNSGQTSKEPSPPTRPKSTRQAPLLRILLEIPGEASTASRESVKRKTHGDRRRRCELQRAIRSRAQRRSPEIPAEADMRGELNGGARPRRARKNTAPHASSRHEHSGSSHSHRQRAEVT
jgi:hypothetical protein